MANGQVTKAQGLACLAAAKAIAEDGITTRVDRGMAGDALENIGWARRDPEDYFDYQAGDWLGLYDKQQVLMALAFCLTLSGVRA